MNLEQRIGELKSKIDTIETKILGPKIEELDKLEKSFQPTNSQLFDNPQGYVVITEDGKLEILDGMYLSKNQINLISEEFNIKI